MTYNVFGGTLNLAESINPNLISVAAPKSKNWGPQNCRIYSQFDTGCKLQYCTVELQCRSAGSHVKIMPFVS